MFTIDAEDAVAAADICESLRFAGYASASWPSKDIYPELRSLVGNEVMSDERFVNCFTHRSIANYESGDV